MLAGAMTGIAGYTLPATEVMIAASALVLGVLIVMRRGAGLFASALVGAFFALFHGMAHAEQLAVPAAAYLTGLLAATLTLHVAGIAIARKLPSAVPAAGAAVSVLGCCWIAAAAI
jgi:urease accessory protein